jgi:sugar lactone lactonase YvrE
VTTDSTGNVYVADAGNNTIRRITAAGSVTTLAGRAGVAESSGSDDGTGSAARFNFPSGVTSDSSGNVYVGDSRNNTIRKVTSEGVVTTLAGLAGTAGSADGTGSAARFNNPIGVATDSSGNIYVADFGNSTIRKITSAGVVTTLAGLAGSPGSADGTASAARFNAPQRVATDSVGNVYVADTGNQTIRKITAIGAVTTLAGLPESRGSVDGSGSAARFNDPIGVATDSSGNVYVADYSSSTIRRITPAGVVMTLAGLAGSVGNEDGTGSAARFFSPVGLATDSSGNVYVADSRNSTIRKISPGGSVITVAGLPETRGSLDGTGSTARFNEPRGVATDSRGNVYVADTGNNAIRRLTAALADAATIDISTGALGATRQLDTSSQTAISWEWSVIRRPVDSVAVLASASVRNPTFTPDVAGLFVFRLIATGTSASRISTVDLTVVRPRRRAVRHFVHAVPCFARPRSG